MRISLVGFANLISGFILIFPWLKRVGISNDTIEDGFKKLEPYRNVLGIIDFCLGGVSLLNRMGTIYVSFLPGGYPQSLVVIGVGLTLGYHALKGIEPVYKFAKKLEPYQEYIGGVGILFGLHAIF